MKKKKEKILVFLSTLAIATSAFIGNVYANNAVTLPITAEERPVVSIPNEAVPLASTPEAKTTTKTTTSTKKLDKAATTTKTTTKVSTDTKTSSKMVGYNKVTTQTVTVTTTKTKYTKGSKTAKITTTVKTTITTTTLTLEHGEKDITSVAPNTKANPVKNLFKKLGYKVVIDPTVNYTGYFSSANKSITLKKNDKTTIYHELGHFLGYRAGNVDRMPAFKKIYDEEKSLYTASNKSYVLQNPSEYFAESYRNYIENEAKLKKERPKTYEAIVCALNKMK